MSGQGSDWRERLHANPSRMEQELAINLEHDGIPYQTQVEISVTTADFYFTLEPRPLIVFVDGRVHLKTSQMTKGEETRTLLRKKDTESQDYTMTATQTTKDQPHEQIPISFGGLIFRQSRIRDPSLSVRS